MYNPDPMQPSSIGFCDGQYYYLLPDVVFSRVCRLYADQSITFPLNRQALFRQLKNEGVLLTDGKGKATRTKRIGSNVMRVLWVERSRVDDGAARFATSAGEQIHMDDMIPVEHDGDNPF